MNKIALLKRTSFMWRHLLPLKCHWSPRIVYIEPTNVCNLKCTMCPQSSSLQQRGFMEFDLFRKVVDEVPRSSHIHLYCRGEPMLHPQVAEMSQCVKQHGNKLTICTNGTLSLGKVVADRIVFNGVTAKDDVVREAASRFRTVALELFEPADRQRVLYALSVGAVVYLKKYFQWDAPCKNTQRASKPCLLPWLMLGVFYDGTIIPCCADFEGTLKVGNLHDNTLRSVWNGSAIYKLRRQLRSRWYGCADRDALLEPYEVVRG